MAPNRREELKKKQDLQARFQLAQSANHARASSWLIPKKQDPSSPSSSSVGNGGDDEFLNLKVVPSGSTLGSTRVKQTVSEFIQSRDPKRGQKEGDDDDQQRSGGPGEIKSGGSRALNSLLNKIRDESRRSIARDASLDKHRRPNVVSAKRKVVAVGNTWNGVSDKNSGGDGNDGDDGEEEKEGSREALRSRSLKSRGKISKNRPF
ncbi:uncharacterized protein LODBEIA_P54310 [Lodderomyces beijingensis]|uniref:Uncharacterized protein n=1 Tax=Lodderomyces beijingensis TaxID=1775926 RepID=A0ABP0ZW93_9ASCO